MLVDVFVDARELPADSEVECDVCIVGAGFAGIALAQELSATPLRIVLLESGGFKRDSRTQDLYRGSTPTPGHGPLHLYRERRFGGTSHVWGGRCSRFDPIDFETRPWVPHSGWPVGWDEMQPFYERAYEYCDLGRYGGTVEELNDPSMRGPMIGGFDSDALKTDHLWLFSLPTNFASKYRPEFSRSPNVQVYLHANCLSIHTSEDGVVVDHVIASSLRHNRFKVKARKFVLAMGGLETTRLLLSSDSPNSGGIGNQHDNLGRYYISHVTGSGGRVRFAPRGDLVWDHERTRDRVYSRRTLRLSEQVQANERLLNCRFTLDFPEISDPGHGSPILSAVYLVKGLLARRIPPEYSAQLSAAGKYRHVLRHIGNCVRGLPVLALFSVKWLWKRGFARRKLPSVVLHSRNLTYNLHFDSEQTPNAASRVFLGEELDEFGQRRLVVEWQMLPDDAASVLRSMRLVTGELGKTGVGVVEFDETALLARIKGSTVGSHHIGTTRMSMRPEDGVVDSDCRVFGVDNLFIASSSTFPTSSFANPTLTIVAFAIRIADHLKEA